MNIYRTDSNLINTQPNYNIRTTSSQPSGERHDTNISCIFCHNTGHDVIGCCDERLLNFNIECFQAKRRFNHYNRDSAPYNFRDWLLEKYTENREIVKAYAMKKIGYVIEFTNVYNIISDIMLYEYPNDNLFSMQNINRNTIRRNTIRYINPISNFDNNSDVINFSMVLNATELFEEIDNYNNSKNKIITILENPGSECQDYECPICYDILNKTKFVKLICKHEFCSECVLKTMKTNTELSCALCRKNTKQLVCYTEEIKNKFT